LGADNLCGREDLEGARVARRVLGFGPSGLRKLNVDGAVG